MLSNRITDTFEHQVHHRILEPGKALEVVADVEVVSERSNLSTVDGHSNAFSPMFDSSNHLQGNVGNTSENRRVSTLLCFALLAATSHGAAAAEVYRGILAEAHRRSLLQQRPWMAVVSLTLPENAFGRGLWQRHIGEIGPDRFGHKL